MVLRLAVWLYGIKCQGMNENSSQFMRDNLVINRWLWSMWWKQTDNKLSSLGGNKRGKRGRNRTTSLEDNFDLNIKYYIVVQAFATAIVHFSLMGWRLMSSALNGVPNRLQSERWFIRYRDWVSPKPLSRKTADEWLDPAQLCLFRDDEADYGRTKTATSFNVI